VGSAFTGGARSLATYTAGSSSAFHAPSWDLRSASRYMAVQRIRVAKFVLLGLEAYNEKVRELPANIVPAQDCLAPFRWVKGWVGHGSSEPFFQACEALMVAVRCLLDSSGQEEFEAITALYLCGRRSSYGLLCWKGERVLEVYVVYETSGLLVHVVYTSWDSHQNGSRAAQEGRCYNEDVVGITRSWMVVQHCHR